MCNSIPEKIKIAKVDGPNATNTSGTSSVNANAVSYTHLRAHETV